ncbi:MAG: ribosome maturation factor RimP [Nocardioidaceae bacterium]
MTGQQPREELLEVLQQPLAAGGFDLEDVEISTAGRRRVVRVLVDTDAGVTLDDIAQATTQVSGLLDDSDVLGDNPYTLEVTSPGTDRPLTQPRHWRRNIDRLVKVTTQAGETVTGRIIEADDEHATIAIEGSKRDIAYREVVKARIEIEFNRPRSAGKE